MKQIRLNITGAKSAPARIHASEDKSAKERASHSAEFKSEQKHTVSLSDIKPAKKRIVISGAKSEKKVHAIADNKSEKRGTTSISESKSAPVRESVADIKSDANKVQTGSENKSEKAGDNAGADLNSEKKMKMQASENKSATKIMLSADLKIREKHTQAGAENKPEKKHKRTLADMNPAKRRNLDGAENKSEKNIVNLSYLKHDQNSKYPWFVYPKPYYYLIDKKTADEIKLKRDTFVKIISHNPAIDSDGTVLAYINNIYPALKEDLGKYKDIRLCQKIEPDVDMQNAICNFRRLIQQKKHKLRLLKIQMKMNHKAKVERRESARKMAKQAEIHKHDVKSKEEKEKLNKLNQAISKALGKKHSGTTVHL